MEVDDETGEVTKELDDPDLLQNRPALQRALVISGEVKKIEKERKRGRERETEREREKENKKERKKK